MTARRTARIALPHIAFAALLITAGYHIASPLLSHPPVVSAAERTSHAPR